LSIKTLLKPVVAAIGNYPWRFLLYQLLFVILMQQLGRLIWFFGNAYWLQPLGIWEYSKVFFIGFYFDLPLVAYCFAPLWIWWVLFPYSIHKRNYFVRSIAVLLLFLTLLLNAIDAGYSNVTSKRSGKELLDVLLDPANNLSTYILDYWWGVLLMLGLALFLWRYFPMPPKQEIYPIRRKSLLLLPVSFKGRNFVNLGLRFILIMGMLLFAGRGGTRLRPLRASDASEFVLPEISPLLVSTPFSIISSFQSNKLKLVNWVNNPQGKVLANSLPISLIIDQLKVHKAIKDSLSFTTSPDNYLANNKTYPSPNIVLIVVESLARDYTGFLNGAPYTPFLDKLAKNPDAVVFPYCFANGTKSIEMAPSIFAGMPNLMEDFFITSSYSTNRFTNAFGYLRKLNYTTQFFHGSNNGTMGFRSFFKSGGLQEYYGINEYPHADIDFDGHWGIFDEPYLQYVCKRLSENKQPFFSSVFTLSSHHPYAIPKALEKQFPGANLTVQKTIAYADYSLEKFFESARKQPWFTNTIFIITGDHTSHGTLGYFYSPSGHYEVPLLVFAPGRGSTLQPTMNPVILQKTCSQLDILPTCLSYVWNTSTVRLGMGRSLLDSSYAGYSYHYDKGLFYIIQYPFVLVLNDRGECVDFYRQLRNSNKQESLLTSQNAEFLNKKMELFQQLKATIQLYRTALTSNRWDELFNNR